ncbi:MAG: methyltransferase domain-containing protein [Calditrichaceae bacterium]|nr:methyltransferase domain-containing protein [Calditrichaceae bacterium]
MMNDLQKNITLSLDGEQTELFNYFPYLMQDLWEIGSSPEQIIKLMCEHGLDKPTIRILDLGCGKGSISVRIAKEFGCRVHGIDGMEAFIDEARQWAVKYQVDHLCRFEAGDIREAVKKLHNYDIAILGSIGPVLGNVRETLEKTGACLKPDGYIILDDGYFPDGYAANEEDIPPRSVYFSQINQAGFETVAEYIPDDDDMKSSDAFIYHHIEKRAQELIREYPQYELLFENYLKSQREENERLENEIICSLLLLKKK